MMTMTLECVECGESVAYGRLSCRSCGALLAAVAGARRPAVRPTVVPAPQPAADLEPEPAAVVELAPDPAPAYTARLAKAAAATADPEPNDRFEAVQPALPVAPNPAPERRSTPTPVAAPAPEAAPASPTTKPAAAARRNTPAKNSPIAAQATTPTATKQPVAQAKPPAAAQPPAPTPADAQPTERGAAKPFALAQADSQPAGRLAAKLGALAPSQTAAPAATPLTPAQAPRPAPVQVVQPAPAQAARPAQVQPASTAEARPAQPEPARSAPTEPAAPAQAQPSADLEPSTAVRSVGASVTPPYMKRGRPAPAAPTAHPEVIPLLEPADIATPPPTPWTPLVDARPMLVGRPYPRHLASDRDADRELGAPPSAYRPPTMALATAGGVIASTSNWSVGVAGSSRAPSESEAVEPVSATRPLLDTARFAEIAGWFAIVGATMSVLGFLLPWSGIVIGSGRVGGYFDQWGLAGPTHPLVVLGLLGLLALAILRTPIPTWIWSTTVSLALGGVVIGLTWPYHFGPLRAEVGVTVAALGGLALLVGGAVATWAARHEATDLLV